MTTCRLVDVDGVIFKEGTREFLPGVKKQLLEWQQQGDELYLFTCRPPAYAEGWTWYLRMNNIHFSGYIQKPFADEYYFYDDKLKGAAKEIGHAERSRQDSEGDKEGSPELE